MGSRIRGEHSPGAACAVIRLLYQEAEPSFGAAFSLGWLMPIYSATFSAIAVSAAQDLFELVAPASGPVRIREIRIGQYTDFGDAAAEILSIQLVRGHTTTGSGGSAVVPSALGESNWSRSTLARNNTTIAANGSPQILLADAFNIQAGWWYRPPEDERIIIQPSARFVVRITLPADALTVNGTLIFEEF